MAAIPLFTYKDVVDHLVDYLGDNATQSAVRDARRAALDAYRDLTNGHDWSYFVARGRVNTVQPQTTGTIQYQDSSGPVPRLVTLTGATWPSWAGFGQLVITGVVYEVAALLSATTLQLTIASSPQADLAPGTAYTLYRDSYPLPCDFVAAERLQNTRDGVPLVYGAPREWLARQRVYQGPGTARFYTFFSDPHSFGAMAVGFFPPPDTAGAIDFIYKRRGRRIVIDEYNAGTVSTDGTTATVTGSGTAWTQAMVGSVIRLSATAADYPTGQSGANRPAEENVIVAVASTTSLTADAPISTAYSGVKYEISDPVDVEDGAMLTAYLRGCEAQNTITRIMKNAADARQNYHDALIMAKEADRRNMAMRVPGEAGWLFRLSNFPRAADAP